LAADGEASVVEVLYLGDGRIRAAVDRRVLEGGFASEGRNAWVSLEPSVWCLERPDAPDVDGVLAGSDATDGASLTAPMPGTVVKVLVGEGDEVEEGQTLLVLEAMKMEQSVGPRTPARCGRCLTPGEHAFPGGAVPAELEEGEEG
jgi:3-methylcrotonyl-CoA carboxylase alpha subunit